MRGRPLGSHSHPPHLRQFFQHYEIRLGLEKIRLGLKMVWKGQKKKHSVLRLKKPKSEWSFKNNFELRVVFRSRKISKYRYFESVCAFTKSFNCHAHFFFLLILLIYFCLSRIHNDVQLDENTIIGLMTYLVAKQEQTSVWGATYRNRTFMISPSNPCCSNMVKEAWQMVRKMQLSPRIWSLKHVEKESCTHNIAEFQNTL